MLDLDGCVCNDDLFMYRANKKQRRQMRQIDLCQAEAGDAGLLALLNRALIIAEQSDNTMSYGALLERMQTLLASTYQAWLFRADEVVVGYALVDMSVQPRYLRHFCIVESLRGQGYGTAAFESLHTMLGRDSLEVDVLAWNSAGAKFWAKMGFAPRSIRMQKFATVVSVVPDQNLQV
jgi:predicted acetyltransferase